VESNPKLTEDVEDVEEDELVQPTNTIEYLNLDEMVASIKVLASEGEASGRAASGKWAVMAHSFARIFTATKPAGSLIGDLYRAAITGFLDSALGDDKKNSVRHNGQKQLSASLKIVRDADMKLETPLYVWADKKIKAPNAARDAIVAWVKDATDAELMACAGLLPGVTEGIKTARAAVLAGMTAENRAILGL
jgi:hypothetical protein